MGINAVNERIDTPKHTASITPPKNPEEARKQVGNALQGSKAHEDAKTFLNERSDNAATGPKGEAKKLDASAK